MSTSEAPPVASPGLHLSSPKEFLSAPGEPAIQWNEWKEYFLNYVANLEDCYRTFSPERKKRILMYCLAPEGLTVYNQLQKRESSSGDLDSFKLSLLDLDEHFSPTVCVAVMRHAFFQRKQEKHESVEDYVSALKETCHYM